MRDSQSSGATKVAVPGATSISYAVVSIAQSRYLFFCVTPVATSGVTTGVEVCSSAVDTELGNPPPPPPCLLYTSDAADERSSVDLGGRRILKKKKKQ